MSTFLNGNLLSGVWGNFLLLLPMVIIFTVGNVLRYAGFFQPRDTSSMTKLLYWVVSPALLFRAAFGAGDGLTALPSLFFALLTCGVLAALIALALAYAGGGRRDRLRNAVSAAAATKPNAIYLGLPTVLMILGERSLFYVSLFAAIAMPLHNILSPVFAAAVSTRGTSFFQLAKKTALEVAKNPLVSSSLLGLFFALAGVKAIPSAVDETMKIVGSCATGLSLLALGASMEPKKIFSSLACCWRDVLVRLAIHPALLLLWFYIFPAEKALVQVIVLIAAMPTAATMFVLAEGMALDSDYAAQLTVATTMLSILSIPVWAIILNV